MGRVSSDWLPILVQLIFKFAESFFKITVIIGWEEEGRGEKGGRSVRNGRTKRRLASTNEIRFPFAISRIFVCSIYFGQLKLPVSMRIFTLSATSIEEAVSSYTTPDTKAVETLHGPGKKFAN